MIQQFLDEMRAWGCVAETGANLQLPKCITNRYHNLPDLWFRFIEEVQALFSADETIWFLCASDYDTRLDHAWQWNEWEELSLKNAGDDEKWRTEIKAFWDEHLPIVLSVREGYAYYAISMADGSVVYGSEPEFEECAPAASSFTEFLERLMDGTIPF